MSADLKSLFTEESTIRNGTVESIEAGNICNVRVGTNIPRIRSQSTNLRVGQSVMITAVNNKKYIIAADKNQQRSYTEVFING